MDVYSLPVPGSGGKTCSQIFEEAGCDTPASPTCGACMGGPKDTYARLNEPQVHVFLQLHTLGFSKPQNPICRPSCSKETLIFESSSEATFILF